MEEHERKISNNSTEVGIQEKINVCARGYRKLRATQLYLFFGDGRISDTAGRENKKEKNVL